MRIVLIILCVIMWIICGLLSVVISEAPYMRGRSFDPAYMKVDLLFVIVCILLGPMVLFVLGIDSFVEKISVNWLVNWLTQIIWKIANLGVEKEKEGKEND